MTDTRTPAQRRRIMAAIRSRDTTPELRLRKALYALGVRGWRCHYRRAPGKPDLAWPARRVAVFVDGAFWHGHPSRHRPGRSGDYWDHKIARNVERDREVDRELDELGWVVERIWDFEIKRDLEAVAQRVAILAESRNHETGTYAANQQLLRDRDRMYFDDPQHKGRPHLHARAKEHQEELRQNDAMRSTPMLIEATATEGCALHVRFEDSTSADIDLSYLLRYGGVFEPLRDPEYFRQLRAGPDAGTIVWPNEADIAPETLYAHARRRAGAAA